MMNKNFFTGDYFKLFVKREGKVVLGRYYSNLWLLTAVLTLTFFAIAFSNASMNYLSFRMNDPFINWLNIENTTDKSDYAGLAQALEDTLTTQKYHILGYQEDYKFSYSFFSKDEQLHYLTGRFFQELNTPLIDAILGEDNVVDGQRIASVEDLDPQSIGVIMTEEMLGLLGYETAPAYIDYARHSPDADTLGFRLYSGENYAMVPLPVIGVVKKLPGNVDFISSSFFLEQDFNDYSYPFYMNNTLYASSLHYYVPETISKDDLIDQVFTCGKESDIDLIVDESSYYLPQINSYKPGVYVSFFPADSCSFMQIQNVAYALEDTFKDTDLKRVYDFDFSDSYVNHISFLSVHFKDLERIKDFEAYVKDEFYIEIEMSQVNAKDNFNAVSILANILSWAIVFFSIICIILFVVNLLQSYFQKVKRNMGTFKAFGISNSELISIYVLIMAVTIIGAIIVSLALVYFVELILPILGVVKEGMYSYLLLWNPKTIGAIVIIVASAITTVYAVMKKLLSATPGDLIYDRQ